VQATNPHVTRGTTGAATGPQDDLHVAFMRLFRRLKRLSTMTGLDPALVVVLHDLGCSGPTRTSVLAETMRLDQSTVSRHVRALEQLGLVERTGDPDDRRAALLSLTPAGKERLAAIIAERRAIFSSATAGWSDDDRAQLAGFIDRTARLLEARDRPAIDHDKIMENT
jgi:DNA-binding MarR family transcriptional regulator